MSLGQLLSKVALALDSLVQLTIWVCVSWFWIMLPVGDSYRKGVSCLYLSLVPVSLSLQAPVLISGNSSFLWLSPGPLSCVLSERETFDFLQVLHSG